MGSLRVKFWGTRGLISSPRHDTAIYGGNTPCIQLLYKDHLIIVDTGFGVTNLGEKLLYRLMNGQDEMTTHIFYTHFHWDHIQGLPFFQPIYFVGTNLKLYSPETKSVTLDNLDILFDGSYSPFEGLMNMPCATEITELQQNHEIDGLRISFAPVDHGSDATNLVENKAYSYRFDAPSGESIAIVTDHEARPSRINDRIVEFARDSDILIHDGQYLEEEYIQFIGWGHSTARQALDNACKANAKMAIITHHDPKRTDRQLQTLHRELIKTQRYAKMDFDFAREEIEYAASGIKNNNNKKAS